MVHYNNLFYWNYIHLHIYSSMGLSSYQSLLKFLPCHKHTNIERNGSYGSRFKSFIKSEESFISKCLDKAIENPFVFLISLSVHDPSFYNIYRWSHHHSDESSTSWWHKITVKIVLQKFIFQDFLFYLVIRG